LPPPDPTQGDVVGPASSVDNAVARFNGITGKLLQNSLVTIDDLGAVAGASSYNGAPILGDVTRTIIGDSAGHVPTSTGLRATVLGALAATALTSGNDNTLVGYSAGAAITIAARNTAFGSQALANDVVGINNAAFGFQALNLATGQQNTGIGASALVATTTGANNTALGSNAGAANTVGTLNVFLGRSSGGSVLGGSRNVLVGSSVAGTLAAGNDNTIIGDTAGPNVTTSNNIIIGSAADTPNAALASQLSIGGGLFGSLIAGDIKFRIGGAGTLATQDTRLRIVSAQDSSHPILQLDNSVTLVAMYAGSADPNGVVSALNGSVYVRANNALSNVYINQSVGTGTTWVALV
jgi:hypothetical protein